MNNENNSSLEKILQDLENSQKDLKEIFSKRTKEFKKIDITKTHDVLDDFSIHLAFDFETAKGYFSKENTQIPSKIDKNNLDYDSFIIVLKEWLKKVAFLNESDNEKAAVKKEGKVFNKNSLNPNYIQNAKRWNDLIETNSEKLNTHFLNYVGSLKVNTVASEHIVTSSEKIPDYKIKEIKVPTLKANDTISVQDLQMVLRGVFYEDSGYVLVDKPTAAEDFFATVNSYKTFLKSIEKYYKEVKKEISSKPDFNYRAAQITMTQAMEIFDFFLRNDPNVSILEENEFNKNINIKAQDDERNSDQKDLIKETMIETIVKYQSILGKCKTEEERKILQNLMNIIKQQLNTFLKTESSVNTIPSATFIEVNQEKEKKQLIKEEISPIISKKPKAADRAKKNEEGLKDIFVFIAKQGHVVGKNSTFERVQHESQILSLGEFFFFCKTFNLYNENFDKNKSQELFKKTGEIYKEVTFPDFKELVLKTANEIFKNQENMSQEDKMNELCLKLGIDDQKSYKEKLHYTHLPFSSAEKEMFRFLPASVTQQRDKPMLGKSVDDIRDDIKKRKIERDMRLKEKKEEKSRIASFKKTYEKIYNNSNNRSISLNRSKDNYSQLQVKSSINKFDLKNKISWDKLENISYSDLKALNDDNFKPTDLFDENYDQEDNYYLAEYNLTNDKAQKEKQNLELKKNIEEYGRLKPYIRPTQKKQYESSKIMNNDSLIVQKSQLQLKQPLKNVKAANISNQILDRARQIDIESRKKEKQLMKNMDEIKSSQLKKGLQTIQKKKNLSVN